MDRNNLNMFILSPDCVEHYPICLKVNEVLDVQISGISCSKQGIVFLSDSGRGVVYRLDLNDGTCFNFGRGTLGK
jgi:hypothetical protein